ncbi:hypothetical protein DBR32_08435 [Taibaiella sp. KBW10]|uniref:hypothetical protein n=1 Tax=Taibaiella sp. KBW10 TaxID=2153357 RepID=UPI000F59D8AE|nr:hypothetical protein [Taibaiella sp. KBW10]RQO30745.1 hypothetical protein DBR32_08435 [Taibaiella sp. KBW10]
MKNQFIKTIAIFTLVLSVGFSAAAKSRLVYDRTANTHIGITPNTAAIGKVYKISDKKGRVILQGTIDSDKTIYIPTRKLSSGSYLFMIGSDVLQNFEVQ